MSYHPGSTRVKRARKSNGIRQPSERLYRQTEKYPRSGWHVKKRLGNVSRSHAKGIKDRIKSLRRVKASELRENPKNWRIHSDRQKSAFTAILDEIGFAGACLAYETDGELVIIDGHLRAEMADDEKIPVLVTDLTPEEADKVLATFDPLGSMAEEDRDALEALMKGIQFDSEIWNELLLPDNSGGLLDPTIGADSEQYLLQEQSVRHLSFGSYKIPLTDSELAELEKRADEWLEKTGVLWGFADSLLGAGKCS